MTVTLAAKSRWYGSFKLGLLLIAASHASSAHAINFACQATLVGATGVSASSLVHVDLGYGYIQVCSLSSSIDGVDPEVCKGWLSLLLTSRATGKVVRLFFSTDFPSNAGLLVQDGNCAASNFGSFRIRIPYFLQSEN